MAPEKRQITRNRTSYSCQTCRRRKVKCDKKHPICGTCEKNDEECIYATENDEAQHKSDTGPEPNRKRKMTSEPAHDGTYHVEPAAHPVRLSDKLVEIQALLDQARALADETGVTHGEYVPTEQWHQSEANESLQSISKKLKSLDLLFQSDGGPSKPSSNDANILQPSLSTTDELGIRPHLRPPPQDVWENDFSIKSLPDPQSNVLFRCWLLSAYSILPIVDPYEALEKYEAYHHWYRHDYDKGVPNPVQQDLPLIMAVSYGGLLGMSARAIRKWWPEVSRRILLCSMRLHFWRAIDNVTPSINSVAAEVMMRYMCHERYNISRSSAQLAILIRNAQVVGIHRSKSDLIETPSYQIQRRLWWAIVHLDTLLASSCLLPPLLGDNFFDHTPPSELKDFKQATPESLVYEASVKSKTISPQAADFPFDEKRRSMVSPQNLVSKARALWTTSMRKIVTILMGADTIEQSHIVQLSQMLTEITFEIKAIIDRLPTNDTPELSDPPPPTTGEQSVSLDAGSVYGNAINKKELDYHLGKAVEFGESQMPFLHAVEVGANALHKWARITLSMMLDQIYCFSFAPFLKDPKSKIWTVTRTSAINHCQQYFRRYISLATSLELESFRWTWLGMFQPGHASRIMLIDLYERPFSEEAVHSRALFDQMLLLNYPAYGIVGGSHGLTFIGSLEDENPESWALLNHLRSKAWQKAKLDPSFLWNEQDQLKNIHQAQQGMRSVPGKVRPDQPLAPQKLLDEHEWRRGVSAQSAPFGGLSELIKKIRGTKSSASTSTAQTPAESQTAVGSNFYGDQILSQSKRPRTEETTVNGEASNRTVSPSRSTGLLDNFLSRLGEGDGDTSRQPGINQNTQTTAPTALGQGVRSGIEDGSTDAASCANSPALMYGGRETFTNENLHTLPEFGHIYPQPRLATSVYQGAQADHNSDFDWNRWDTAYGYPSGSNAQGLACTDPDMIAEALTRS